MTIESCVYVFQGGYACHMPAEHDIHNGVWKGREPNHLFTEPRPWTVPQHAEAAAEAERIVQADMEERRTRQDAEAVAAAMAKLADEVRGLKRSPLPGWLTAQAEILALIENMKPHDWVPFRSTDGRRGEQCMCGAIRWTAP